MNSSNYFNQLKSSSPFLQWNIIEYNLGNKYITMQSKRGITPLKNNRLGKNW